MATTPDAHALVSAARDLMRNDSDATAGLWPRAAALLARQALEAALACLWSLTAPGLERARMRCQILCAGQMLNDAELGGRVGVAWNVLSDGCHHSAYELPPDAADLGGALDTVWALAEAVDGVRSKARL
jgi:hypothetical protein